MLAQVHHTDLHVLGIQVPQVSAATGEENAVDLAE